jgi:hypothetical protein
MDVPASAEVSVPPGTDWIDAQSESSESLRSGEESVAHGEGDQEAVHEQKTDVWLDADSAGGESVESVRDKGLDDWLDADSTGRGGSGGSSEP